MKRNFKSRRVLIWITSAALVCAFALCGINAGIFVKNVSAYAEAVQLSEPAADPSPAIYVAQKNAASVVGVLTYKQSWNRSSGNVQETMYSQGSGVVVENGGYVLTNYHVIEGGDSFKVLMPNGEKAEASLVGSDSPLDLAVLKVDGDAAYQLAPVSIGSSSNLIVGSTAIAIGNPGGEDLANTVTQGVVSALERSSVYSTNTKRNVDYIQHDAPINNGNSGGGLFNYKGELIGINTLKYGSSGYSGISFEGLGFAIPVDTAYPVAMQLIQHGKVIRPQMGVTVSDVEGPDEPMSNYAPASVCIRTIAEGSPAEQAGLKQYDFIYAVNGERVTTFRELTGILDHFQAGDSVSVTVVRYNNVAPVQYQNSNNYYNPFGGFGFGFGFDYDDYSNSQSNSKSGDLVIGGGFEYITVDVSLVLPEETDK